jgi:formate hydrogenlyase subunit 4
VETIVHVEVFVLEGVIAPAGVQALQVLTVLLGAPLVSGIIARVEARIQGRTGPRVLQPYYDLAKLFGKESVVPEGSSLVFLLGPAVAFACYLIVPLLIPVLTTYGLPLGYMGDILGGGFILALAGFSVALAATESGAPYAQLGASRAMTFSAFIEPTILFVVFAVAMITSTDLPYALAATVRSSSSEIVRPAHVLAAVAFFLVVLVDTGRIPVETHSGTLEFGMIDEGRTLEHSGPAFALARWGSAMKQLILYTIFINVFVAPWGLASTGAPLNVVVAIFALLGKAVLLGSAFAVIDNMFSKLRLFKIADYMAAAFLLAGMGVLVFYTGGG